MNYREQFKRILLFKSVDQVPLVEYLGHFNETILRWITQGFPSTPREVLPLDGKIRGLMPFDASTTAREYFGLKGKGEPVDLDLGPIPCFVAKILESTERYETFIDAEGIVAKRLKSGFTMSSFIEYPVKSKEDFEDMKKRFDPKNPRRYPKNWGEELFRYYETTDQPVCIFALPGFFNQPRAWMGTTLTCLNFYREPEFMHDIMEFWSNFIVEACEEAVKHVKLDYLYIWEDMSYNKGPFISPKTFEEFMLPHYKKVTRFFREHGVDLFILDTDGNIEALIPLLLDGGVNCLLPMEAAAGMDAIRLREKYGSKLSFVGNIDKRALIAGKKAIDKELKYKLPLVEEGGFIPSIDHLVPPDVSLENYSYYIERLKEWLYGI